jgi:hypothetical protein
MPVPSRVRSDGGIVPAFRPSCRGIVHPKVHDPGTEADAAYLVPAERAGLALATTDAALQEAAQHAGVPLIIAP